MKICQTEEFWIRNGIRVNPKQKHKKPEGEIFEQSLALCTISPSSVMISRQLFEEVCGFDEDLKVCEDYDLWLRIASTEKVGLIRENLLTKYGGHLDQLSKKYSVMDRFRIYSMLKVYGSGKLNSAQAEATRSMILKKTEIVKSGTIKRGRDFNRIEWLISKALETRAFDVQKSDLKEVLLERF